MDFFSDRIPSLILILMATVLGLTGWLISRHRRRQSNPPDGANAHTENVPEFHLDDQGYPPGYQPRQQDGQSSVWLQELLRRRRSFSQARAQGTAEQRSVTRMLTDLRTRSKDADSQDNSQSTTQR